MYIYENYIKRTIDIVLASLCLVPIRNTVACGFPFNKKGGWG